MEPGHSEEDHESLTKQNLKTKFYSYISYLMISIYLTSHFEGKLQKDKGLDRFTEDQFAAIFQYQEKKPHPHALKKGKRRSGQEDSDTPCSSDEAE